jgi:hypothetical protein
MVRHGPVRDGGEMTRMRMALPAALAQALATSGGYGAGSVRLMVT